MPIDRILFAHPPQCHVEDGSAVAREEDIIFEVLNGHIRHGNDLIIIGTCLILYKNLVC